MKSHVTRVHPRSLSILCLAKPRALLLSLLCCGGLLGSAQAAVEPGKPQQLTNPDQTPEGIEKSDWASIRAAHTAWEHSFQPIEGGWQARNKGQQWTTKFDARGFLATPKDGAWTWGLELDSYGAGAAQTPVAGQPTMKAEGQRLTYQWDANLQEWWVNDARGLEHGYTLAQRPADPLNSKSSKLNLIMNTRGTLSPKVSEDALGVLFQDAAGATVLNYTGLKVWDADGTVLASRFEAAGGKRVRLVVDDRAARYPITIDPIAQQAYVKPPADSVGPALAGDSFGVSVAVSGDTVVVGASGEDSSTTGVNSTPDELAPNAGAAYVFVRSGATWSQQAYLKASNTGAGDFFGSSVAVSEDTVVVGAIREDSSSTGINGTPNELATDAGAAYVFVRSGTTWNQQAYLKVSNTGAGDNFGYSVAVSGDTVVVGARYEDGSTMEINGTPNELATDAGAAYVFVRSGTTWNQQAYLKAGSFTGSPLAGELYFGSSVAVSGDTVVVGAPNEGRRLINDIFVTYFTAGSGTAYVFVRSGTTWSQQAYLKASNPGEGDQFGSSVAVSGDTVVVGASGEDSSSTGINGTPNELATDAGAAYVFVRGGTTWSQQAYLKASQVTGNDFFGYWVAVSGDTVVVGVPGEDSNTTGINSTPDELGPNSGAAYVFVRSGTTWSQQTYLKASNIGAGDGFGWSVAVDGETVVVGAYYEDSSTTGVNSTPDELAPNAGAAYIFGEKITAPVANAQTVSLDEDATLAITLTGTDADGDPLTYAVASGPSSGSLTGSAPNLTYTPGANYHGPDSFTFTVNDGTVDSAAATVSITVNPVNDAPVGNAQTVSVVEGGTLAITLTGSDTEGSSLTYAVGAPSHGTLTGTAPNLTYTPGANYHGPDSFTFTVNDGAADSAAATVSIRVLSENEDTDGDGLNDATELRLAALGFDWQVAQNELVATLSSAGLYTQGQLQAIQVQKPIIARDPVSGLFNLTLRLAKSTDLSTFQPLQVQDSEISVNPDGTLNYRFQGSNNAAFFRLEAE